MNSFTPPHAKGYKSSYRSSGGNDDRKGNFPNSLFGRLDADMPLLPSNGKTFSTTTIPLSTSIPKPIISAKRIMVFMVILKAKGSKRHKHGHGDGKSNKQGIAEAKEKHQYGHHQDDSENDIC